MILTIFIAADTSKTAEPQVHSSQSEMVTAHEEGVAKQQEKMLGSMDVVEKSPQDSSKGFILMLKNCDVQDSFAMINFMHKFPKGIFTPFLYST